MRKIARTTRTDLVLRNSRARTADLLAALQGDRDSLPRGNTVTRSASVPSRSRTSGSRSVQLLQSFSIQILSFKVSGSHRIDRDINSQCGCLATS